MPEDIGDILKSGGFTDDPLQAAMQQVTTPPTPAAEPAAPPAPAAAAEPVAPATPTPAPAPVVSSDVEFYKKFGVQGEEELRDSLNELETLRQRATELEEQAKHFQELEQAYEELAGKDEASLFGSPEEYKNFLIAQKLGLNKDHGVVQRIIRSDLDKLDDLDVLSLRDQYDVPRFAGKDDKVKKALLEEIGVDVNDPDFKIENYRSIITEEQDLKLARMARQVRDNFNQLKGSVTVPDRIDPKAKFQDRIKQRENELQQLIAGWKPETERVVQGSTKLSWIDKNEKGEVVDEFHYDVDKEFLDNVPDIVENFVTQNRVQNTPENVKAVTTLLLNAYRVQNWDKILRAARNDARTSLREQLDKQRFNGQPVNTTTAPPTRTVPTADEEIQSLAAKLAGL